MKSVIESIRAEFQIGAAPIPEIGGFGPELGDFRREFGGRSWSEIPPEVLDCHNDAFMLMSAESLRYYLPAFLVRSIQQPRSTSAESFLFFVTSDRFYAFSKLLSLVQRNICFQVGDYVIKNSGGYLDHEREKFAKAVSECLTRR